MPKIVGFLVDVASGFAVLAASNAVLDPVPLAAGAAWALGFLFFFFAGSRSLHWALLGFIAGALLGIGGHLFSHFTGRSGAPLEGLGVHALGDGAIGVLCGALALTASFIRHWRRLVKPR